MIDNKKEPIILFLGDIFFLCLALWFTLLFRYWDVPSFDFFKEHLTPFSFLFVVWILNFFVAGLYEKHTLILRKKIPSIIFNTQIINSVIAVVFFYFIPFFGIAPKTNLFIYLILSSGFIFVWRYYSVSFLGFRKKQNAILIGSGKEMVELRDEIKNNNRYNIELVSFVDLKEVDGIDFQEEIINRIYSENVRSVIVDLKNKKVSEILPHLYNLIFSDVRFVDMYKVYEDIFDRAPLSLVGYNWFLENISSKTHMAYDFLKKIMDVAIAFILGVISLIFYPFVYLAIKLDDGGPAFFVGERVGQNGRIIKLLKFRSMGVSSKGGGIEDEPKITKVGSFLRKTRIDELPQLFNVLKGDLSLIGPRPECFDLVKKYNEVIPYYNIRHLIKPGLSGWAQMYHKNHPHHGLDIGETKVKLSYDLYYIKNRSLILDLKITLKTIRTLLSRAGA
ncbi:exopolysaccharide biosynthesis polyprenyl glycosylphosphotransferase [Patescibacteria group bacterium]|nr:exopolysaccharide biosynthesis polyprenyl glycosylphosphotransferase [Patescibacteria group bacterium]MCG2694503.1 exopolysaccharide biosynthesis polyprenyl glycosylphosphotransferase [Candidatus Parcubacteria bacterium]